MCRSEGPGGEEGYEICAQLHQRPHPTLSAAQPQAGQTGSLRYEASSFNRSGIAEKDIPYIQEAVTQFI